MRKVRNGKTDLLNFMTSWAPGCGCRPSCTTPTQRLRSCPRGGCRRVPLAGISRGPGNSMGAGIWWSSSWREIRAIWLGLIMLRDYAKKISNDPKSSEFNHKKKHVIWAIFMWNSFVLNIFSVSWPWVDINNQMETWRPSFISATIKKINSLWSTGENLFNLEICCFKGQWFGHQSS